MWWLNRRGRSCLSGLNCLPLELDASSHAVYSVVRVWTLADGSAGFAVDKLEGRPLMTSRTRIWIREKSAK